MNWEIDWEQTLRILEGLSYIFAIICGVVVAVIAFKGLGQLRIGLEQLTIARKAISLESKRDALRCANEAITSFFNLILPQYEKAKNTTEEKRLLSSVMITEKGDIDFEAINDKTKSQYDLGNEDGQKVYIHDIKKAFEKKRTSYNVIESFSSSFTSGLADEKTAYSALGMAYCTMIEKYINVLKHFNQNGYYNNTVTLYTLWKKRLAKEEVLRKVVEAEELIKESKDNLQKNQEDLVNNQEDLVKIKKEIDSIQDNEIVSLGTEDKQ